MGQRFGKRARTDAQGRLVLEDILPGRYQVVVSAESWSPLWKILEVPEGATVEETWTLSRDTFVRGTVTQPDGTPQAGARVTALLEDDPTEGYLNSNTDTDEKGRFNLPVWAPGAYRIKVRAPEHHLFERELGELKEGQEVQGLNFRLAPHEYGGLTVQVVAPDGETPVAGAWVGFDTFSLRGRPTTNEEGRIHLEKVLLREDHALTVYHPGFTLTRVKNPPLQAQTTTSLKVTLLQGGAIAGRVRTEKGSPGGLRVVAGVKGKDLTTYYPSYSSRVTSFFPTTTQPDGTYRIDQLAPGTYTVFLYRGTVGPRLEGVQVVDGRTTRGIDFNGP